MSRSLALLLAAAAFASACSSAPDQTGEPNGAAEVACGSIERPAVQGGSHLLEGAEPPVPYTTTPPTSGWHASGAFEVGIFGPEDPLTEPEQVSVLEADAVVVTWNGLSQQQRDALEALVRERFPGQAAVTFYDGLPPGQVALTAWGVLQRCDGLDAEAIAAFIDRFAAPADAVGTPGAHD